MIVKFLANLKVNVVNRAMSRLYGNEKDAEF